MLAFSQKPVNAAHPLIRLPEGVLIGRFCRRIKRFTVEIELNGQKLLAHCNNTGSMLGLLRSGADALVSPALNPRRKLAWTLERLRLPGYLSGQAGFWAGVNTGMPNKMLAAAFKAGLLEFAAGYQNFQAEAVCGGSRLDGLFTASHLPHLWVECKNVSMVEDGVACFPDSPTERGRKHLRELVEIVEQGGRAAMFYLVQRPDGKCFAPADFIDYEYACQFYEALAAGVECYAHEAVFTPAGTSLGRRLQILPKTF